ncbi:hypothetical protein RHMOL_Rhmol04G0079900 [Rhododendron molle]|uniref:Uncharacterized protein n=1 Tax=Rhododendron molle TaxID=49168 RepID=A0ACC0NY83_RHOML|nr:hypothetical protein RHMOL_Rhmol04G0079900 [Rhododendron molle]
MVCTETILGKIVEKIVDTLFQSVGRHVGFMLHYKQNLKNLEDEVKNLQEQRSDVEGKVNEANRQGDAIDKKVSVWLEDADKTGQEVEEFTDEKTVKENMLCFSFNFISRYRLSKEAERKVVRVKHLAEKGGNIGRVAHPKEAPPELEFPCSRDYEGFHSRDKVFEDIVVALKDPEVNRIGVYGAGGVGKTTMVTKVGELVKKDGTFDEVVIAVVSQDVNVRKIQGQLADRLNLTLSGETEVGRANRLWNRLDNGKKNLIILDDVWQELDLKEIGIPIIDENKSCKVVLTSRNRNVWKNMDVKEFAIKILSEEESWTLFKKKVGNYVNAHELREIAWAVCKECQGLPVVINAIGAALKGKDMYAWRDALDKLNNSMLEDIDQKVYKSLKWSFDQLDTEDAKSCFLLCCLFPEDAEIQIDDLVRYYMAGRTFHPDHQKPDSFERALDRVHSVVSTLIRCCLLLDENYDEDVVKMHDVVRDVAISIAKGEKYSFLVKHGGKDWPGKATYEHCSVISLRPHDMREFPDELVCPALHTLRLDGTDDTDDESWLQVPDRFFGGTENLTVLDLNNVTMSPILPASLAKLAKLQMLYLNECTLGDIAILKDLKDHLEILSLRRSNIKVLPQEVRELTRLRLLDMDGCNELELIPKGVISKLLRLEELYMPWEFSQWEGTRAGSGRDISCVSLDELMSLTRLTTLYVCIQDPALLPKDFTFDNLVRFNIFVGGNYYSYSKDSTGVLRLGNIHLANPLEGLLGKPKWCRQRNGLCLSKSFNRLTHLRVTDCRLKYLFSPSLVRGLVGLKKLEIERCMDMEGVIGNEGEEDSIPITFSRLNWLRLTSLPNLKSFYPKKEKITTSSESSSAHDAQTALFTNKVALPVLERLKINSVTEITAIWDKQMLPVEKETESSFCHLKVMFIGNCDKLMNVVALPVLERLKINSVTEITAIWDKQMLPVEKETESSFCHLKVMFIGNCDKLMNVVGGCPKIEATVTEKQKGKEIDHYATRFPELTNLTLWELSSLLAFPKLEYLRLDTLGGIVLQQLLGACEPSIKTLIFSKCDELSTVVLPRFLRRLRNVDLLVVKSCIGVREAFHVDGLEVGEGQECVGSLIQVRKIELDTLPKLTCLWNKDPHGLLGLQNLEYLTIKDCPLLRNLLTASVAKALGGLKALYLRSCSTMEEVIATDEGHEEVIDDEEIAFPKLEWLILKDLSNLKSFCSANYNFKLPSLKRVVVNRCPNMQTFTSGSVHMPPTLFTTRGDDGPVIEDLNKHLEERHLKGDRETIEADEMRGAEEKFSELYWAVV